MPELSHIDAEGKARMVDVGSKPDTERVAVAQGEVHMQAATLALIKAGSLKKGDVLTVAQLAGVMAAKKTSDLIPLCHPLILTHIDVVLTLHEASDSPNDWNGIAITAIVRNTGKTGVEMEALTAVSVAALTVYDMAKAVEKTMQITNIRLTEKHGGKSDLVV
jgi:cyclic pyranopterin monophosphate synthase